MVILGDVKQKDIKIALNTLEEKERLLQEGVDKKWMLFFEHDRINELCTLQQTEKGIRSGEVLKMSEL